MCFNGHVFNSSKNVVRRLLLLFHSHTNGDIAAASATNGFLSSLRRGRKEKAHFALFGRGLALTLACG